MRAKGVVHSGLDRFRSSRDFVWEAPSKARVSQMPGIAGLPEGAGGAGCPIMNVQSLLKGLTEAGVAPLMERMLLGSSLVSLPSYDLQVTNPDHWDPWLL